jgi:hypothetical protein
MKDQKEVTKEQMISNYPAQHFNDYCKEGYDLLTNVLNMPSRPGINEAERKDRAKRGRVMKMTAI